MSHVSGCEPLKKLIRTVPDFPKPGILFYDITTLLKDKAGFAQLIDAFAAYYIGKDIDLVLGIEARGFIFGPALASMVRTMRPATRANAVRVQKRFMEVSFAGLCCFLAFAMGFDKAVNVPTPSTGSELIDISYLCAVNYDK